MENKKDKNLNKNITVNDFFCGCGGIGIGFKNAGFNVIWACDIDKFCIKSYHGNVGDYAIEADIKNLTFSDIPKADVWSFGFPCQDLSVAGEHKGFRFICKNCNTEWNFEDNKTECPNCGSKNLQAATRSGMFFEIMRLLDETKNNAANNMPSILFAENVRGLKPYLPVLEEEFAKRGYIAHIQILNSKYWGVPQNRERYYIVGTLDGIQGFEFPIEQHDFVPKLTSVLEEKVDEKYYIDDSKAQAVITQALEKLKELDNIPNSVLENQQIGIVVQKNGREFVKFRDSTGCVCVRDRNGFRLHSMSAVLERKNQSEINVLGLLDQSGHEQCKRVHDINGIAPTCTAVAGGTHHVKIFDPTCYRVRKLTPTEYGRLQAFPMDKWKQVVSNTQAYKQFGNSVTTTVITAIAENIKKALIKEKLKNV